MGQVLIGSLWVLQAFLNGTYGVAIPQASVLLWVFWLFVI